MPKIEKSENYISLLEATKICKYSQEYLSLRARQGKLNALKIGRNWVTKKEWLEQYLVKADDYKNNLNGNGKKNKIKKEEKKSELDARFVVPPRNLPVGEIELVPVSPFSYRLSEILLKKFKQAITNPATRFGFAFVLILILMATAFVSNKDSLSQFSKDAGVYETLNVFKDYGQWAKNKIEEIPGVKEISEQIKKETKIVEEQSDQRFQLFSEIFTAEEKIFVDNSEIGLLKQEIAELKEQGIITKEIIKELEVSKVIKIEEIERTIKQYVQIDDVELAMLKNQLEDLDSWKTDFSSKIQSYPGNTNVPTAPIYISSPGGIEVGGHGSFVSLGVQGSIVGNSLSVKGSTYLGTNPSLSTDTLTVGMTSTFLQTATFSKGITANLGIGDTSADYPLEVLSTTTQFAISHTEGTAYAEFSVDSNGDLNINPSGGNVTINDAYTLPSAAPSDNQILKYDAGTGLIAWETDAGGAGTPGGSDGQMQYNDGGSFGGTSQFYYDDASNYVGIGDASPDYLLEILTTATQLALTNVDDSKWVEFFVDGNGDLTINPSGGNVTFAVTGGSYTFPSGAPADNQILKYDSGTGLLAWEADAGGVGSGDIATIGDCADGDCFTGSQGTTLTFNNAGGDGFLSYNGDFSFDKQLGIGDPSPDAVLEITTINASDN